VPDARLVTIPGAGHLPNIENPEAFNRALLELVDGLPA
jgi:pimeloyl-ACP methyl ester carboxylesterase